MSKNKVAQLRLIKQDTSEGIFTMHGIALTKLIHSLIREHGIAKDQTFYIHPDNFPTYDKKLILSHVAETSECEESFSSSTKLDALYQEYSLIINKLFEDECSEVYNEDMNEFCNSRNDYENYENMEVVCQTLA